MKKYIPLFLLVFLLLFSSCSANDTPSLQNNPIFIIGSVTITKTTDSGYEKELYKTEDPKLIQQWTAMFNDWDPAEHQSYACDCTPKYDLHFGDAITISYHHDEKYRAFLDGAVKYGYWALPEPFAQVVDEIIEENDPSSEES